MVKKLVGTLSLPTEFKNWEFDRATATFMHPLIQGRPGFYFQVQCDYGNTYEWRLFEQDDTYVANRVYSHWDKRRIVGFMSHKRGFPIMERLHFTLENYPALLFNRAGEHPDSPRNRGFVQLANRLLVHSLSMDLLGDYI